MAEIPGTIDGPVLRALPHAAVPAAARGVAPAAWWAALGAMLLVLALPPLLVQIPPLTDYPNHLARMAVLAHPDDAALRRIYAVRWALIPNVAMDLIVPALMRVLPVYAAGKAMVLLCVLLPATGAIAHSRALFGVRSYWQLLVGLVAYNGLLLMGFLNFEASIGGALWLAAGWLRFRDRHPAVTVAGVSLGTTLLFFFHIFGVLFLGMLLASHEAAASWREWSRDRGCASPWRRFALLAAVFAPSAALYALSPFGGARGDAAWLPLQTKVILTYLPFLNYMPELDVLTGAIVFVFAGFMALPRRGRAPMETLLCLAALAVLYAACPYRAKEGAFIDARFPVMAGFVLFAGLLPTFASRRVEHAVFTLFALLFVTRMTVLGATWIASVGDVAELRGAIAPVQPGERVLVVDVQQGDNEVYARRAPRWRNISRFQPSYRHLAALVLLERKAFWSAEFAMAAQQPLRIQPAYRDAACPSGAVPSYTRLVGDALPALPQEWAPCLVEWQHKFDYVLVESAGGLPDPGGLLPEALTLVRYTDMAALYRVHLPAEAR